MFDEGVKLSIIRCPNCKHKISSKSKNCAYCGCPITEDPYQKRLKFLSKWIFYTSFMAVILSIFLLYNHISNIPMIAFMVMILVFMEFAYKSIINKK